MKILYLSLSYVPSRRASSVQVMKMCAAMARLGHSVTLTTKRSASRQEDGVAEDHEFYGVEPSFEIVKLPRPAVRGGGLLYSRAMARLLKKRGADFDLIYSRDLAGALHAARRGLDLVCESHGAPETPRLLRLHRELLRSPALRRLVLISGGLLREYQRLELPTPPGRVMIAPDGADPLPTGDPDLDPLGAAPRPRIGYVGHFYPGKGIEVIAELARRRPEWYFHLVGGSGREEAESLGALRAANVTRHGFVPHARVGAFHRAFDVLLMPYQDQVFGPTRQSNISAWMSPLKMFEYMAAGRAIVSSDLPVLREVLTDGEDAVLVPATDLDAWERAIAQLLRDDPLRARLGDAARRKLLAEFTWDARAGKVLSDL